MSAGHAADAARPVRASAGPPPARPSLAYLHARLAPRRGARVRGRGRAPARRGPGPRGPVPRPLHLRRAGGPAARSRRPARRRGPGRGRGATADARDRAPSRRRRPPRRGRAGRRPAAAAPRRAPSGSTPSTSTCCSSRWRRTSTRASSGSTATSTTTCRAAARARASRSSCAGGPGLTRPPGRRAARLGPARARWSTAGLLLVEDPDRPFLTRSLRVPDRVTAHLLGDDTPRPAGRAATSAESSDVRSRRRRTCSRGRLAAGRAARLRPRSAPGASGGRWRDAALAAARPAGHRRRPRPARARRRPRRDRAAASAREARLRGAGLVAGPVDALVERGAAAVRAFARGCRRPSCSWAARGWDPAWSREPPLLVDAPVPDRRASATTSGSERLDGDAPAGLRPRGRDAARSGSDPSRSSGPPAPRTGRRRRRPADR